MRLGLLGFFGLLRDLRCLRLRRRPIILELNFWEVSCTFFEIISWYLAFGLSAISERILAPVHKASLPKNLAASLSAVRKPEKRKGVTDLNIPPKISPIPCPRWTKGELIRRVRLLPHHLPD